MEAQMLRSLPRRGLPGIFAAIGMIALAGAARGQTTIDNDPDMAPGFTNSVFHTPSVDSINLYNGQITIPIAIGPSYPLGPKLKYQAFLTYNSYGWDYPYTARVVGGPFMAGDTAFGIGWSFTLGAIKGNMYIAPDGSQHIISAFGTSPGYYKTTDATSFYLHDMGTNGWEMWDGDGNHYVFGHIVTGYDDPPDDFRHDYGRGRNGAYLTQLTDPFGNGLSATYPTNGTISSPCWVIVNPYCPPPDPGYPETPSMQMKCNLNGAHWVPQTISLTSGATISIGRKSTGVGSEAGLIGSFTFDMPVGGIATTRTWSLDYDATSVPSACGQGNYNTYRLTKVWLPSDLASSPKFQFDYTTCPFPLMSRMTLPTGGTVDYVWGEYNFYHGRWIGACHPGSIPGNSSVKVSSGPILCGAEPIPNFPYPGFDCTGGSSWLDSGTVGVIARTETDPISGLAGTTTYTQYAFPFGEHDTNQTATFNSQSLTVVVFPPDANGKQRSKSILFYAGSTGETTYPGDRTGGDIREADYDFAVQAYAQPISQPVCSGGTDRDFCPNHAVRVTQRTFEYDASTNLTNRHLQSETKIYGATNGLGQCTTCLYHSVTYSNSYGRNWDGFTNDSSGNGRHYNVETHSGNLGGDSRQVVTTWSPVVSPWFPNLFDKRITSDATGSLNQYFDYDHTVQPNGFLRGTLNWDSTRNILFAECLYTQTSQGAVDTHGNVASRYTGTFAWSPPAPDPHSCTNLKPGPSSWTPGNGDIFATDFTYLNGQKLSARANGANGANGSSQAPWLKYDVTRDSKTGWITSSRDTAGLQTSYLYDSLGRPTSITPPPGEAATIVSYPSAVQTIATRNDEAGLLTYEEYDYDGFGRTIRERRQMPGGSNAKRFTKFDGRGYAYFESEWVADSLAETLYANAGANCSFSGLSYSTYVPSSAPGIYRACFDPYGRPQLSTGAGYSSQVTISRTDARQPTFAYYSDTTEASTIACVNGTLASTTPHCSGGSDATTTTMKDAFGRSTSVIEPNGFTTSYGYDVNGKLSSVAQGAQARSFSYDKFGFLRTETTPEKGTVTYDSIGSLGNVRQQTESGGLVSHSFDYAGRLTGVSSNEPRTYLTNTYDEATDGTVSRGWSLGKLTTSMASNYYPSTGFTTAFFPGGNVTDSLYYSGVGGRLSQKKTTLSNGSASTVEGWTYYNSLGLVAMESYPRIDSTGVFSVTTSYTAGLPTGVSANGQSVVTSATYNPAGGLASYTAGNGITTTIDADPNLMPRPRRIYTSDGNFDTGVYAYDGSGNITSMGANDTFTYDANSRLLSAAYPPTTQTYGYDRWGNLVQKAGTSIGVDPATNRLNGPGVSYDSRGNVTTLAGETYSYDALNRQTKHDAPTSHWSYLLDGANERIVKAIPPGGLVARRDMARIILQARGDTPRATCAGHFQDVPCTDPERGWIEKFYDAGITAGCSATPRNFCPDLMTPRWQMAVFIAQAMVLPTGGTVSATGNVSGVGSYNCMTGGTSLFADVLPTDVGCKFIHYIYAQGVTAGCSAPPNPRHFCPNDTTPHWQLEVFTSVAWNGFGYVPPGATYTFRGAGSAVLTEYQDSKVSKDYVYLGTRLVGTNESAVGQQQAGWKFHATDHLGSVRLTTNAAGAVVERRKYWPWGEEAGTVGAGRMAFAGMELDLEATRPRYYDHARSLETGTGRFLSPDLLGGKIADPQSWNRYTYARNNPLRYIDPNGQDGVEAAKWVRAQAQAVADWGGTHDGAHYSSYANVANTISTVADWLESGSSTGNAIGSGADSHDLGMALATDIGRVSSFMFSAATAFESVVGGGSPAAGEVTTLKPGAFATESIPARGPAPNFTAAERAAVRQIGEGSGCHTCGTMNPGTKSGNFVLDHQPPSGLVKPGTPQQLYPQCATCSFPRQANEVKRAIRALDE
jgi:RHS repeat-associated protein